MRLEIVGTAQTAQAQAGVAELAAQVELLNKAMERTTKLSAGATPKSYYQTANAVKASNTAFKNALASTGQFHVQTVKVNDAVERQTQLLQRQALSFKQVFGPENARMMDSIYHKQLAMKNMYATMLQGGPGDGTLRSTFAIPREIPARWDDLRNRIGFVSHQLASASNEMIKWGKNVQWAGRQITVGLTMPMVAFGAAAGVMAYKADQQFTRIRKVYNTTANQFSKDTDEQARAQAELDRVREAGMKTAVDAAREYGVSVKDTLSVQADLAATGERGQKLQAATTAVVKNATLGEIDYQTATKATIALQQQLHLSSKDLADTWAYMNSVENQTSLTMKDFATAIPIALGPLRQMGGTVQDLGTLLTGMVSRGMQVGKAANAIKAAAQRLLRPSQQVQEEFKQITGADIAEIGKRNKGDLLGMLQDIYKVTKDLSQYNRGKVLAGLFGSFQLSTMSAMVDSMGDLATGVGQVTTAQNIGTQSAQEWGRVQNMEIKQFQDSMSGRFKRAVEGLKAELVDMGTPFLHVAGSMVKAITEILHAFNAMPGPIKEGAIALGIFAAAIGPITMLVGLSRNFQGIILKSIASLGIWATKFKIVNEQQWAMEMSAKMAEKSLSREATEAQILTRNIEALTYALQQQALAAGNLSRGAIGLPAQIGAGMTSEQRIAHFANSAPIPLTQKGAQAWAVEQNKAFEASMARAATSAGGVEQAMQKTSMATKLSAAGGAAFALSMAATLVSSNKTTDEIAKWGMLFGIVVPAVAQVGGMFAQMTKSIMVARAGTTALAAGTAATEAGMLGTVVASESMLGPIGLGLAAITAIGAGAFLWSKHESKITEERRKQNAALYEQNGLLDKALHLDHQRLRTLNAPVAQQHLRDNSGPSVGELISQSITSYQKDNTGKEILGAFKDASDGINRATVAEKVFIDTLKASHGDVLKAKIAVTALYRAAGYEASEADDKTNALADSIVNLGKKAQQQKLLKDLFRKAFTTEGNDVEEQGLQIGKILMDGVATSIKGGRTREIFSSIADEINTQWQSALNGMKGTDSGDILAKLGITSPQMAQQFASDVVDKNLSATDLMGKYHISAEDMQPAVMAGEQLAAVMEKVRGSTRGIIKYFQEKLNIPGTITSLEQLFDTFQYRLRTITPKGAKDLFASRVGQIREENAALLGTEAIHADISDKQKQEIQNQIDAQLKQNGFNSVFERTKKTADDIKDGINAIPSNKNVTINITSKQQMAGIMQDAFSGVQNDMAQRAQDLFASQQQAAMDAAQAAGQRRLDAAQAAGQARMDALQRRQEAAQAAFDAHWQHREDVVNKYYDNAEARIDREIKAEQKAEAIRQRIYEAEQARLEHMTDAANRAIDYNVALQTGQLDEAAKIQNDIESTAMQWALSQGQQQDQNRSQRRVDRLQAQKDRLEKERQARLKNLQKQEDDARRHFQRMQEMEKNALQKSIDAHQKALQTQVDNQQAALQSEWDNRKDNLDDQLALFTSYIASSKGDLEKWMKSVGLTYQDFGINTLQPMSDKWGTYFQDAFMYHMRVAGSKVASDNMWTALGSETMKQMLSGMGFPSMSGFKHFIATGQLPSNFGKAPKDNGGLPPALQIPHGHRQSPGDNNPDLGGFHGGGVLGEKPSGRGGYAGGMKNDEGYFLGQFGEMVMTKAATQKYGPQLRQMNNETPGVGGETAIPTNIGLATAFTTRGVLTGFMRSLKDIVKSAKSQRTSGHGKGYVPGPGGRHRPVPPGIGLVRGIHDTDTGYPAIDIAAGMNTPAYAVGDGVITRSQAITSGGSPGNGLYIAPNGLPYRSYGNVEYLKLDGGPTVLYAHLNKRLVGAGKRVSGGALIGRTGNTGNSTGPHLHFGSSDGNPMQFMRTGGHIMRDGLYYGHGGETVLKKPLSKALDATVRAFGQMATNPKLKTQMTDILSRDAAHSAFRAGAGEGASGDTYEYTIPISVLGSDADADEIADQVMRRLKSAENRLPRKKTNRT